MKKLLTILLALLVVTGVVFAADDATLHLKSTVEGFLKHGFYNDEASVVVSDADDDIYDVDDSYSWTTVNSPKDNINLAGNNPLGYYNFWTNTKSNVTVTFTANSMTVSAEEAGDVWNVPYKLSFEVEEKDGRLEGIELNVSSIGSTAIGSTTAAANASNVLFTTSGTGSGYISIELVADFNSGNYDVLPEGTYTGTIVAAITNGG